jgi:hypothetical protein
MPRVSPLYPLFPRIFQPLVALLFALDQSRRGLAIIPGARRDARGAFLAARRYMVAGTLRPTPWRQLRAAQVIRPQ